MHVDTCTTLFINAYVSNLTNKMKINTNILILMISVFLASVLVIGVVNFNAVTYAQTNSSSNIDVSSESTITINNTSSDSIPTAQSVYDTGVMALPSEVKGVIIFIPDEAHHCFGRQDNKPKEP